MECSNYLPYVVERANTRYWHLHVQCGSSRGAKTRRHFKRYAHKRTRRKAKLQLLAGKELTHRYGTSYWDRDW